MSQHLDTLRRMRDARPSHRCGGCELCRERAALEEAIRVMERDAADAKAVREYEAALLRGSVDTQTEAFGGEPW